MANLKDIVATLAILSAGTLTLTGCEKEGGETTTPDEVTTTEGEAAPVEAEAADGEASCSGEEAEVEAPADGEAADGEAADGEAAEGEASCSGAA
jgi:hypothetical protein